MDEGASTSVTHGLPSRQLGIKAGGRRLNAVWLGPGPDEAPTLVFLHEGLGSIGQWQDFPAALAAANGCGALVYDRYGYGGSEPLPPPYRRELDFMHKEGRCALPEVLDRTGVKEAVLIGHSDGASIALLAASTPDLRIRGVVSEAAHVFVEAASIESIEAAVAAYRTGDLRERLARYHGNTVDSAFRGWANAWLDPDFEAFHIEGYLRAVTCPVLALQGSEDAYGTPAQLEAIAAAVSGPVRTMLLPDCGHSLHKDAREAVMLAAGDLIRVALER